MNDQLDRSVRSVLADIVDAAPEPTEQPSRLLTIDGPATGRRRPVLAAAAAMIAVVGLGGVALLSSRGEAPTPAAQMGSPSALAFATPTVRMSADSVEVIVGANVFTPTAATVDSDPGSADYTTLELSWIEGGAERRLYMYFASDGSSWWADQIRTSDAAGEWIDSPEGERWFTSPLGTAWTGNLDLPNLRIRNMSVEAFVRPAACDNPTSAIAVVAAYPTIEGIAADGNGFAGRIDLIDTTTCTPIDPALYTFTATSADPTVAEVVVNDQSPVSPTTVVGDATTATQPSDPEMFGRFDLVFRSAGETTIQVTVTDSAGTTIGSVTTPVVVRPPDSSIDASPDTTMVAPGVESIPAGSVVCVIAGASERTARLCSDELGGAVVVSALTSADSFVMPCDPTNPDDLTATANVSDLLGVAVRTLDTSWLPTLTTDQTQLTYLVLGTDEGPNAG
jgi:hypothetical protein